MIGSNYDATAPSADTMSSIRMTKIWNVLSDGTLRLSLSCKSLDSNRLRPEAKLLLWKSYLGCNYLAFVWDSSIMRFAEIKFTTTEVHLSTSGHLIRFVKAGTVLERHQFVRAVSTVTMKLPNPSEQRFNKVSYNFYFGCHSSGLYLSPFEW